MSRTYFGEEGQYEIEDDGLIVQRFVDRFGKLTDLKKIYEDVKKIPNLLDRRKIEHIIQWIQVYKFAGRV